MPLLVIEAHFQSVVNQTSKKAFGRCQTLLSETIHNKNRVVYNYTTTCCVDIK
jgi:hypothetical protein